MLVVSFALVGGCSGDDSAEPSDDAAAKVVPVVPREPDKPQSPVSDFTNADIQNWCIAAYKGLPDSIANLNEKIEFFEKRLGAAHATADEQAVRDVLRLKESAIVAPADLVSLTTQWDESAQIGFVRDWVKVRDEAGIVTLWNTLNVTMERYRPTEDADPAASKQEQKTRQFFVDIVTKFEGKLREFRESWPEKYASQLPPTT
jgi:hypothetical protein